MHSKRLTNEKLHGKKLLAADAEKIWNWSTPTGKIRAERRANYFVEKAQIKKTDTVLEIGCGTGILPIKFLKNPERKLQP